MGDPAGHRSDGHAVPAGHLRQARDHPAEDLGRVRRRRPQAARGGPERLPDESRREPERCLDGTACGRPARSRSSTAGRESSASASTTRRPRSSPTTGAGWSRTASSPPIRTSPTSGTRAEPAASTPPGSPRHGARCSCPAVAKATSGKWRAAPLPQWDAGENESGNWGGSTSAVIKTTKNPIAAAKFAEFLNTDAESTKMFATQQFLFPATKATADRPDIRRPEAGVLRRAEGQRALRPRSAAPCPPSSSGRRSWTRRQRLERDGRQVVRRQVRHRTPPSTSGRNG